MDPDEHGNTQLHFLAMVGNCSKIRALSEKQRKEEINVQNKLGQTPLHIAYIHGQSEAGLLLLQLGADDTIRDNTGKTPGDYLP